MTHVPCIMQFYNVNSFLNPQNNHSKSGASIEYARLKRGPIVLCDTRARNYFLDLEGGLQGHKLKPPEKGTPWLFQLHRTVIFATETRMP